MLLEAVDTISEFLDDAEIEPDDERFEIEDMRPSVDSEVLQVHRYVVCKICNKSVASSAKNLNSHFFSSVHLKKLKEYERAFVPEAGHQLKEIQSSAQSIVSSNASAGNDEKKLLKREKKEKKDPTEIKLSRPMMDLLTRGDIDNFTAELLNEGLEIVNSHISQRVCQLIESSLIFRFPKVRAFAFGSAVTGMGRHGGDLDIFVDLNEWFYKKPSKREMKNSIHLVRHILGSRPDMWDSFDPVTNARTPILRAYCRKEQIDCDLSFSNGLSCCNTQLINYFINLQPVCKKLNAFVKFWVAKLSLGMNSYIVSQLVIFYLQQEHILPSVQKLQSHCQPVLIDGIWNSTFAPLQLPQLNIPLATDFKKYLKGFFYYYGHNFNYDRDMVSILAGVPVEKDIFDHGKERQLPPIFDRFKIYMSNIDVKKADEVEDLFSNYKPLVIQDPFELCHNVAKGIQVSKIIKIIKAMRATFEEIKDR